MWCFICIYAFKLERKHNLCNLKRKNLYRAFSNQRELDYNENYCSSDDTTVGNELQTKH